MTLVDFAEAYKAFKERKKTLKTNITKAQNILKSEIAGTGLLNVVDIQLMVANSALQELVGELNKLKTLAHDDNLEDAKYLKEGADSVQAARLQVQTMEKDVMDFKKLKAAAANPATPSDTHIAAEEAKKVALEIEKKKLIANLNNCKDRLKVARERLDALVKMKDHQEVVEKACKDLDEVHTEVTQRVKRLLQILSGNDKTELIQWEDDTYNLVKASFNKMDEYITELDNARQLQIKERSEIANRAMTRVVQEAKELQALVDQWGSKRATQRALQRTRNEYDNFHKVSAHFKDLLSDTDLEVVREAQREVSDTVTKAIDAATEMLDERKDEASSSKASGVFSLRNAFKTGHDHAAPEQEKVIPPVQDTRAKTAAQEEIDAVRRQRDEQDVLLRRLEEKRDGVPQHMFQPPPCQEPFGNIPDVDRRLAPLQRELDVARFVSTTPAARGTRHWIEEAAAQGRLDPDPRYRDVRSLIKPDLKMFEGDLDDWDSWISLFEGLVHNTNQSNHAKLSILKNYMSKQGKLPPYAIVRDLHLAEEYLPALILLHREYGDPHQRRIRLRRRLQELQVVRWGDADGMSLFSYEVRSLLAAMSRDPMVNVEQVLDELVMKLPMAEHMAWRRALMSSSVELSFASFTDFLSETARIYRMAKANTPVQTKPATKDSMGKGGSGGAKAGFKWPGGAPGGQDGVVRRAHVNAGTIAPVATPTSGNCKICDKGGHAIWNCPKFQSGTITQRFGGARRANACYVCLVPGHRAAQTKICKQGNNPKPCSKCDDRHHTMLHPDGSRPDGFIKAPLQSQTNQAACATFAVQDGNMQDGGNTINSGAVNFTKNNGNIQSGTVSLGLSKVGVLNNKGIPVDVVLMSDNGSDDTIILEEFVRQNGIKRGIGRETTMVGVGGMEQTYTSYDVDLVLVTQSGEHYPIMAKTAPKVTGILKPVNWAVEKMKFPHLVDVPVEYVGNKPTILLGNTYAGLLASLETRMGGIQEPYAELTRIGWIIRGPTTLLEEDRPTIRSHHVALTVEERAEIFYEAEAFGTEHVSKSTLSLDDQEAYALVEKGIRKLPNEPGYEVKLPWRSNPEALVDNRKMTEAMLWGTLAKLAKNAKDWEDYNKAILKYVEAGYARIVYKYRLTDDPRLDGRAEKGQYFLAHHGVRKRHGGKMRAVFNASAEGRNGWSLNKALHCGPKLQTELVDTIVRFRESDVAYTGDIEAMFSRIRLSQDDAKRHRFLYQFPGEEEISVLQMDRVAFGDGPSPCLAISVIHRTAKDFGEGEDEAVEIIRNGLYVDDLLDSAATTEDANRRSAAIVKILANGDFHLAGWKSNDPNFLLMQKKEDDEPETKVLGLRWHLEQDQLRHVPPGDKEDYLDNWKWTKRRLLSLVASIFSPLGLASPHVVKAKIRIAQLHLWGTGWDENLLPRYVEEVDWWRVWIAQVPMACEVAFPRCMQPMTLKITETQLHTFTDASEEAFAAVTYVRNSYLEGQVTVVIVAAKTKVRPKKQISVPKMELQGALLGARLAGKLTKTFRFPLKTRYFWTDSTCVRQWVRSVSSHYVTYVGNRVGEIQMLTAPEEWRHVPGVLNVADVATRSALVEEDGDIIPEAWVHGPSFLYEEEDKWPLDISYVKNTEELRPKYEVKSFAHQEGLPPRGSIAYYSNYARLLRVRAWMFRWMRMAGRPRPREEIRADDEGLEEEDLIRAKRCIIAEAQRDSFADEIHALKTIGRVSKGSKLVSLTPFIDGEGLLRYGGRVDAAPVLTYDQKHPFILDGKHALTQILVNYHHRINNHAEGNHLRSILRREFHIVRGRDAAKKIWCFYCATRNARPMTQLMADLPKERLTPVPAFYHTSMDYLGPYSLRYGSNKSKKSWVCLFACMVTRAVHLEVVESLSADDFLVAFRTFCNLRGQPRVLYTDNGTQFTGGERRIREQFLFKGIKWKWQPPLSPHWGGIHEALVKSVKRAMDKATDNSVKRRFFTEMEFRALMAEVTGFLNGRPLQYLGADAGDGIVLTPNHFLLQRPGMEMPRDAYQPSRLGDHYEFVQATANKIWKLWMTEYLPTLMARSKWRFRDRELQVDDVVLIVDKDQPRGEWEIGWIMEVYTGKDNLVRSAKVKTKRGIYERPIVGLCLLEDLHRPYENRSGIRGSVAAEMLQGVGGQEASGGPLEGQNTIQISLSELAASPMHRLA